MQKTTTKRHAFFRSSYSQQLYQIWDLHPESATCPHLSPAWYIIDLHVQTISNNRTNNHKHLYYNGLSWLETMKVNMLAGGEDTAAPLTLFQDHPRLSSRSPHAASTQRKTFNWVINYTTNKSPSWFLPPLVFLLLFEAAFSSMVVACSYVVVVGGGWLCTKVGQRVCRPLIFFLSWFYRRNPSRNLSLLNSIQITQSTFFIPWIFAHLRRWRLSCQFFLLSYRCRIVVVTIFLLCTTEH